MRQIVLVGWFLVLAVALYGLWQHRFERQEAMPTFNLGHLYQTNPVLARGSWAETEAGPLIKIPADPINPEKAARLILPLSQPVEFLHVRFLATAQNLVPGKEVWEDGRCMIEWQSPSNPDQREYDPFFTGQYGQTSGRTEFVMRPEKAPAIPFLRIENLGISGDFELSSFEATVLQERSIWKIGCWCMIVGWLWWAISWIRVYATTSFPRCLVAAMVWLFMAMYFAIPGPWKDVRPLGGAFQFGKETGAMVNLSTVSNSADLKQATPSFATPEDSKSVGKLEPKGNITLRIKLYAQNARSILHGLLLFAPTLIIACAVGRQPAISLAIILSLAIEASQLAFGFGFDLVDVFDLACDLAGILLGLWVYEKLKRSKYGEIFRISKVSTKSSGMLAPSS